MTALAKTMRSNEKIMANTRSTVNTQAFALTLNQDWIFLSSKNIWSIPRTRTEAPWEAVHTAPASPMKSQSELLPSTIRATFASILAANCSGRYWRKCIIVSS